MINMRSEKSRADLHEKSRACDRKREKAAAGFCGTDTVWRG